MATAPPTGSAQPLAGSLFVSRYGGLTLWTLVPLAMLAYAFGDTAYQNLQRHYQKAFLVAVANVDVIAQYCDSRSDILWEECAEPDRRGPPSDRYLWALMASAGVIDPLNVPTSSDLDELAGKDPAASLVYGWLKDDWGSSKPYRSRGVELLLQAATVCTASGTDNKDPAMLALASAYLSDVYAPVDGSTRWLSAEFEKALRLSPTGAPSAREANTEPSGSGTWLAPADPRSIPTTEFTNDPTHTARALVWSELSGEAGATPNLDRFLNASAERLAVASHVGDEDLVAMLFAFGGLIDSAEGQFRTDFARCSLLENQLKSAGGGGDTVESKLAETTLANFEKLALYIAGQIRVSPKVKQARFWVSIYTGHEQRLILMVWIFGLMVVAIKIGIFSRRNAVAAQASGPPSLSPYENPPFDPADRDNDFDGLASSRWPLRLCIALLPAIGFIGTVRGIMLSLNGADAIVWAETVNERSTAISGLSADLGLAFATTLLALLGGAVLTLLSTFEIALGERLLLRRYSQPQGE